METHHESGQHLLDIQYGQGAPSTAELDQLVSEIKDFQLIHGNIIKAVQHEGPTRAPAIGTSISVVPTPFPKRCFEQAQDLQLLMSELYMHAASDHEWLSSVLEPLVEHDDLLAALWDVHLQVKAEGSGQSATCGIFRSDYMLHAAGQGLELKQVEVNTSCIAGACHASVVAKMHRHLQRHFADVEDKPPGTLPARNDNVAKIVITLAEAHRIYIEECVTHPSRRCVLMVVQPYNYNIADERPIEYGLWDADVPCYRCEWQDVLSLTTLTTGRTLFFRPTLGQELFEVSVIYYRAGFEQREYDVAGKKIRLQLELSSAIKAPDIATHLTTMKAVQQALTKQGVVEQFLPHLTGTEVNAIVATFMPIYTLDDPEARRIATSQHLAANYVLKPNRDGGGHNIYRTDIPPFLAEILETSWKNYILMRLIEPPSARGTLMLPEEVWSGDVVSELGTVGCCIWRRGDRAVTILRNAVAGWTFKTKPVHVDEMSVVKGAGCFDCPELVDECSVNMP